MHKLKLIFTLVLVSLSLPNFAQQWAVSTSFDGKFLYDRDNNLISSQNALSCKYVATGNWRTNSYLVCKVQRPWFLGGGCLIGYNQNFTEKEYRSDCPLDDYIWLIILPIGFLGFYHAKSKLNPTDNQM